MDGPLATTVTRGKRFLDDGGGVEDEANALIPELGCAGKSLEVAQGRPERLDHDVLLPRNGVDDQAEAPLTHLRDHHERAPHRATRIQGKDLAQAAKSQRLSTQ